MRGKKGKRGSFAGQEIGTRVGAPAATFGAFPAQFLLWDGVGKGENAPKNGIGGMGSRAGAAPVGAHPRIARNPRIGEVSPENPPPKFPKN